MREISYKPLWKLLIDKDLSKKELASVAGVSQSSVAKMSRGETISMDVILRMELNPSLKEAIDKLLERKKITTEGEHHPHMPGIRDFIQEELQRQKAICAEMPDDRNTDAAALDACFIRHIGLEHTLTL